jgi:hypothetical protein
MSHRQDQQDLDTLHEIAEATLNRAPCEQVLRAKCRLGLMIDMWAMDAVAGPATTVLADSTDSSSGNADTYFVGTGDAVEDVAADVQQALSAQFESMAVSEAKTV